MRFQDMNIGECFVPEGEKFDRIIQGGRNFPVFEKVDATHAREMKDVDGGFGSMEDAPLVEMDLNEEHPCTWEP